MSTRSADVEMQLSELEMLQSMYPDDGDIVLSDLLTHSELRKFNEESGDDPLRTLSFIVKLQLQEPDCVFEIEFSLPLNYPSQEKISALIRSHNMNKIQYTNINKELKTFIEEMDIGDPQTLQVIEWVNEHGQNYITLHSDVKHVEEKQTSPEVPENFSRLWIYSHHIYNKTKRKNILEWSKELDLTGFSMPGKPGIVCVEGPSGNCEEFWLRIKRLNWKHIEVRHREMLDKLEESCFSDISEVSFEVHGNRGNHMSMGSLFQFMMQHNCGSMFVHLFGVEGRLPESKGKMRRQTWKRLSLAYREDGVVDALDETGTFIKKFHDPVSEKEFGVHGGRDYHMDLGQFAGFLAEHQSHNLFSVLFGVEGKISEGK